MEDAPKQPWRKKYKATPTVYNDERYPSKSEAARAVMLDALMKDGEVEWWLRQVNIRLGADTWYRVDFLVAEPTTVRGGPWVDVHAEDVKGVETPAFRKIRKLWAKYGPFPLFVIKGKKHDVIQGMKGSEE